MNSEPDPLLKAARLALVEGFAVTLRDALELIGIVTLEKM